MAAEDDFLSGLLELQYGVDVKAKLKKLAKDVSWAGYWPENKVSFWNAEAFMWNHKISKEKRNIIRHELAALTGRNLDLGCGSYSYLSSVGFDLSKKMLDFNDNCYDKIVGDLEQPLPFKPKFDSVTAIFVFNYVKNYRQLLNEIFRILKDQGIFVMVLSSSSVNDWQKQQEVNELSKNDWIKILSGKFAVKVKEKDNLMFYRCRKT